MGFLFRKYADQSPDGEVSQPDAASVASEETSPIVVPELRWFPPSAKAQLILIAAAFVLINLILMAVLAVALYLNLR